MPIHPTAIVDPKAELDSSVTVGPYCVIEGHVRVAPRCRLYQNVFLAGWTQIGEDCVLHPGVIVGHAPQDTKYSGERSYCRIGRGTVMREYVTVHRGTLPESETIIGEDCFLLAGSHVAHNCTIGNGVTMINNALLGGHVELGDRVTLGGGAAVHQFVRIGELVMVGGHARVGMDLLPFATVDVEGRIAGLNRIGLRRAKMPHDHIRSIRDAYRVIFEPGLSRPQAITRLEAATVTPPLERLLQFLRTDSKRGLAAPTRREPSPQTTLHNSDPDF